MSEPGLYTVDALISIPALFIFHSLASVKIMILRDM